MLARITSAFRQSPKVEIAENKLHDVPNLHPHTPDYWNLQFKEWVFMFVADDMMKGRRSNLLVDNDHSAYVSTATTVEKLSMFKKDLGRRTYPVCFAPTGAHGMRLAEAPKAVVLGEVYMMRPWQLKEIDRLMRNTVEFNRRPVRLNISVRPAEFHRRDGQTVRILGEWSHHKDRLAFMYLGNPDYFHWDNYSNRDGFQPLKPIRTSDFNQPPYFHYLPKDDFK